MPKIKLTKSELKTQRDALKQFQRFLPTLQLKKQQLQLEMMKCKSRLQDLEEEEQNFLQNLNPWVSLFGEKDILPILANNIEIEEINSSFINIAGIQIPIFDNVIFKNFSIPYDQTDPWLDNALEALQKVVEFKIRNRILSEQHQRIDAELRTTAQRVNLFEKVKIPECRENIRVIQIYLGDQQTSAVGRSKIAKRKLQEAAV